MKTLLYANRAEPKSISVLSILLLAAVGAITKLRCMHRECYIFASQNLCYKYTIHIVYRYASNHNNNMLNHVPINPMSHNHRGGSHAILFMVIHTRADVIR